MAAPRTGFATEVQTNINTTLQFADNWSALKTEFDTFTANGVTITDAYVQAALGANWTAALFTDTLAAMQEVVDYIHNAARVARLYRAKR